MKIKSWTLLPSGGWSKANKLSGSSNIFNSAEASFCE